MAVALPLIAVLLVEGALRAAGVGAELRDPFVEVPDQDGFVALSPVFGASFFNGFTPGVAFDPLATDRGSVALRVVALGGSSTAGFPYSFPYAFPARLEDRLAAALPGRIVEVANLGMTATNSFTVWALAEPVAALRPDAVAIYAGHNEYYGAYGAGSTEGWTGTSIPLKRLALRASRWGIVAGPSALINGDTGGEGPPDGRTLMARVVRESAIEEGSEVYEAGVAQYEANLRGAVERFGDAGIPVFLATLASNLADQPPLGDEPEAAAAYARGRRLLSAGDTAAARASFLRAKEADGLRFRAPEAVNDVVRRLAAEYAHVSLVDAQARFRAASPGGLEGAALFTDHLHPTARGYSLLADAFADTMLDRLPTLAGALRPGPAPAHLDPVEAAHADLQLAVLTGGYPFRKDRTPAEAAAAARARAASMVRAGGADALAARVAVDGVPFPAALAEALSDARAAGDTLATLRLYGGLLRWRPFDAALAEQAVGYALASPTYDDETAVLGRYVASHAGRPFALSALAAVALRAGELPRADALLAAAEAANPGAPDVLFNRARLLVLQGDTARARRYFERYQAARR